MFTKKKFEINEKDIDVQWNEDKTESTGQCFITLQSDEIAKIAAATFDGYNVTKKIIFSACTVPDFYKIMGLDQKEEEKNQNDETSYQELRAH